MTRLVELRVSAEPDAWRAAGVPIDAEGVGRLGAVRLRVDPGLGRAGLRSWVLDPGPGAPTFSDVDGLPTGTGPASPSTSPDPDGPLGVVGIDHVVVLTPDLDRTVAAVEDRLRTPLLRIREGEAGGSPVRQAFFRLDEVILEVVSGGLSQPGDGTARFYGLALTVTDLDVAARHLGDLLGAVKSAVQRDRLIATVRREAGLGTAVALMSPAAERD